MRHLAENYEMRLLDYNTFYIPFIWLVIYIVVILGVKFDITFATYIGAPSYRKLVAIEFVCLTYIFCLLHPKIGHKNIFTHKQIKYIYRHTPCFYYDHSVVLLITCRWHILQQWYCEIFGLMLLPATSGNNWWFVEQAILTCVLLIKWFCLLLTPFHLSSVFCVLFLGINLSSAVYLCLFMFSVLIFDWLIWTAFLPEQFWMLVWIYKILWTGIPVCMLLGSQWRL